MNKSSKIYLIESRSCQGLAEMFMRFQEHYESPEFKGRAFTIDEFACWYAQKHGSFSYTKDWTGFNIPAAVLDPFRGGDFNPLTEKEKQLLKLGRNIGNKSYIIGASLDSGCFEETVQHEFVHGAFYVNLEYRREVESCVGDYNIKPVNSGLYRMGYCGDVAIDETNAYVLVEPETIQKHISIRNTSRLREKLDRIFQKHFGFSILDTNISSLIARTKHILI